MIARKLEVEWRTEIKCGQAVDEQRIVAVGGLSNNWPQNSKKRLNKGVLFHFSRRSALNWGGTAALSFRWLAKRYVNESENRRSARLPRRVH